VTDIFAFVLHTLQYLAPGVVVTLSLVVLSILLGLMMGVPMAVCQVYGPKPLKALVAVYVWIFRGLPNLVLLFLFYFGLFPMLGLTDDPFIVAFTVLGLRSGAYQSQIFRGAIQSIGEGQMTAARSLGMSRWQAIRHVVLPQALRIALPGWSNEYPVLLTDSAVCYAIGVAEILAQAYHLVSRTAEPMAIFLIAAVIYILLNYGGMWLFGRLEKKISIPGFGQGAL
jgi:polar amino acid transport system permease protein